MPFFAGLGRTGNFSPYIEKEPVPSPLIKSPPGHTMHTMSISHTWHDTERFFLPWHMKFGTLQVMWAFHQHVYGLKQLTLYFMSLDQQAWANKSGMTTHATHRWNVAPLYPCGREFTRYSPVHNCLKFSAVLCTTDLGVSDRGRHIAFE